MDKSNNQIVQDITSVVEHTQYPANGQLQDDRYDGYQLLPSMTDSSSDLEELVLAPPTGFGTNDMDVDALFDHVDSSWGFNYQNISPKDEELNEIALKEFDERYQLDMAQYTESRLHNVSIDDNINDIISIMEKIELTNLDITNISPDLKQYFSDRK
eukprot:TRINITY_DN1749_c0_g1_i1.p1 TRINITY_DN1749_c0_g1~~TRINITY_DN1749_c0_g1_i1.p1  ORF type:complete len:157 (+),score=41.29 TRINITY_DN1749_c0_g1_i1:271-741(+)